MLTQTAIRSGTHKQAGFQARNGAPTESYEPNGSTASDTISLMGAAVSYSRNSEIYGESEPAEYLYRIVRGSVRTYKVLNDGRRQIGAFYLPGDLFGLEFGQEHTFSAEAITETKVLVIKRTALVNLAAQDHDVAHELFTLTGRELHRVQDHMLVLIKSAQERVVDFLLEMANCLSTGNVIELPMSRLDIADYLGLTIETVSRTFTFLEDLFAIELPSSRHIVLRNRTLLNRLNS